mmetsp:Transcript_34452/g.90621  ORF Transcript_34452/g.90621 Transcript_34452/m.90621 type:complete len:131 (+) Transcript_34452:193-585(+)
MSHARTLAQGLDLSLCAVYLDLDAAFFSAFYSAVATRRRRFSPILDDDRFELPGAWHRLPLGHALRWLNALRPSPRATVANLAAYVAAEPGLTGILLLDAARDEEAASADDEARSQWKVMLEAAAQLGRQ